MKRKLRWIDRGAIPIRPHQGGYALEGPGFYIWDRDFEEVQRVARELARGNLSLRPSARLLVVPPQDVEGPR
jgi:hypothetical protein